MLCRTWIRAALLALLATAGLSACSSKSEVKSELRISGEQAKAGAQLAYEHRITLQLPTEAIAPRLAAAREACEAARYGECNVLRLEQSPGLGSITVRIVPAGVEPLVALAAQGGEIGERQTTAEDLAGAVADNQRQQQRLKAQQQRLDELAARKDINVGDLIALSREQASVENQLQELEQQAAGQQRRIATNLLTLNLQPTGGRARSSRLHDALGHMLDQFTDGIGSALDALSYGLPFLILGFPLLLLWVWLWRRFVRRRS
jgi:hypothetical protein